MKADPHQVHTAVELAAALKELAAGRTYAELDRAARPERLPKQTLSGMFASGRPSEHTLGVFLRVCGVPDQEETAWFDARERVLSPDAGMAGLVRAAQADPRRLGVHAPIDALGATTDLPVYVARDVDEGPRGVRRLVSRAAERGGLVVLVGGSSVGKTRCAIEALRAVVPQRWLLHPADIDQIHRAAEVVPGRLVVWLDELQRYLGRPFGLTASTVRLLLDAGTVVVATLWAGRYTAYTTPPLPCARDLYAAERELLDLAEVVHLAPDLSPAERKRAHEAAEAGDPRIAVALQCEDYGLIQVIAAAPQLVARWRGADPYAAAVLNAAFDATRLGVKTPLSAEWLRAAAPGYCDARQRAAAPVNWFETALAYATQLLNGAAAALAPIADCDAMEPQAMGQLAGYSVADYLAQYGARARRHVVPPATFWNAAVRHVHAPENLTALAMAARLRWRLRHAAQLYRQAAETEHEDALKGLAAMLAEVHRSVDDPAATDATVVLIPTLEELVASGVQGNLDAAETEHLYTHVLDRAQIKGIWAPPSMDDLVSLTQGSCCWWPVPEPADVTWLMQAAVDAGIPRAMQYLAAVRERAGDRTGAEKLMRRAMEAGSWSACEDLTRMREEAGDRTEAERLARLAADSGCGWVLRGLAAWRRTESVWWRILRYGLEADGSVSDPW